MGISDRDWYRDELNRRERPFGRARSSARSGGFDGFRRLFARPGIPWRGLLAVLGGASAIFVLGIQAHAWWKVRDQAIEPPLQNPGRVIQIPASDRLQPLSGPPARQLPASLAAETQVSTVPQGPATYRCIVDGKVMYFGPEDCRGWVWPNAGEPVPAAPAGISAYGQEMLRSADARIARQRAAEQAVVVNRVDTGLSKSAECGALEQEIQALDSAARQPLSGYEQDRLRAAKTRARSRQFEIRC